MQSVVCTLFEGDYHFGVAALVNSLHKHGFKGSLYIGYRGNVPSWASPIESDELLGWQGATTYVVNKGLELHFLPVINRYHFTNYKPEFMLKLLNGPAKEASGIFYFDPDITNKCNWAFYEKWIKMGVAVVHEVVWNDMPATHPKRQQWAEVAKAGSLPVINNLNSYLNAGFIGVSKQQINFLTMWDHLMNVAVTAFNYEKSSFKQSDCDTNLFTVGDQDLLNLTAMCTDQSLSEIGPEGMDFVAGGWTMSHATGSPKPWRKNYILSCLKGVPPSLADKSYWSNANGIINPHSYRKLLVTQLQINIASFLCRFYSKN